MFDLKFESNELHKALNNIMRKEAKRIAKNDFKKVYDEECIKVIRKYIENVLFDHDDEINRDIRGQTEAVIAQEIFRLLSDKTQINAIEAQIIDKVTKSVESSVMTSIKYGVQAEIESVLSDENTMFRIIKKVER